MATASPARPSIATFAKTLGVKPFKLSRRPKLTERQQEHRLRFAKERKNWSAEDWRRVLWSDESAFELYHPPARSRHLVTIPRLTQQQTQQATADAQAAGGAPVPVRTGRAPATEGDPTQRALE